MLREATASKQVRITRGFDCDWLEIVVTPGSIPPHPDRFHAGVDAVVILYDLQERSVQPAADELLQ